MRIFIIFLAGLACFCAMSATANFLGGNEFWGWVNAICVFVNLGNLSFLLYATTEPR